MARVERAPGASVLAAALRSARQPFVYRDGPRRLLGLPPRDRASLRFPRRPSGGLVYRAGALGEPLAFVPAPLARAGAPAASATERAAGDPAAGAEPVEPAPRVVHQATVPDPRPPALAYATRPDLPRTTAAAAPIVRNDAPETARDTPAAPATPPIALRTAATVPAADASTASPGRREPTAPRAPAPARHDLPAAVADAPRLARIAERPAQDEPARPAARPDERAAPTVRPSGTPPVAGASSARAVAPTRPALPPATAPAEALPAPPGPRATRAVTLSPDAPPPARLEPRAPASRRLEPVATAAPAASAQPPAPPPPRVRVVRTVAARPERGGRDAFWERSHAARLLLRVWR